MQLLTQHKIKSIEEAPRDGTKILAWHSGSLMWVAVHWCGWGGGIWQCSNTGHNMISCNDLLTHWMEQLPSPDRF